MMAVPIPANEDERLGALEALNIVETPADETYDRIVRIARATFGHPIALISLVDREKQWFKARLGMEVAETPRSVSFCAHAIHGDAVMVVDDATKDPRFSDNPLVTGEDGIRFYAGAPLTLSCGNRIGTLCLIGHQPGSMNEPQRELLRDMAAIVVSEMELRKTAGTDKLTGQFTRRMIDDIGHREFSRARRQNGPLTVALIDVDHFKSINDTFGHPAGDAVLRALGPVCKAALRSHDFLGRYGGEEFVAILPGTSLADATGVLERMRTDIANMMISELGGRRTLSASIGGAELEPGDNGIAGLIARADAALYRAKKTGRNRVVLNAA